MATPPDFSVGQVLTAAQMNAVGLWLVKTQTIATGSSDITVSDAFVSDFNMYLIHLRECSRSTIGTIEMQLSGITGSNYVHSGFTMNRGSTTISGIGTTLTSVSTVRADTLGGVMSEIVINAPNQPLRKSILVRGSASASIYYYDIHVDSGTSVNDIRLFTTGGATFGCQVFVYGFRK